VFYVLRKIIFEKETRQRFHRTHFERRCCIGCLSTKNEKKLVYQFAQFSDWPASVTIYCRHRFMSFFYRMHPLDCFTYYRLSARLIVFCSSWQFLIGHALMETNIGDQFSANKEKWKKICLCHMQSVLGSLGPGAINVPLDKPPLLSRCHFVPCYLAFCFHIIYVSKASYYLSCPAVLM
jgi:hypothetical protein